MVHMNTAWLLQPRLRGHFAFVNYFVVFGVTQRRGLILKRGGGGVCQRRREHLGAEQQESPRSNKVPLWKEIENPCQEKGSTDSKRDFFSWSNQWKPLKNKYHSWFLSNVPDDLFPRVNGSCRRSDVSSSSLQIISQLLLTASEVYLSSGCL